MKTLDLNSIIREVRLLSDLENSDFVTDAELTQRIDKAYAELYYKMVAAFEDYFVIRYYFALSRNNRGFRLPTNFYKLKGLSARKERNSYFTPLMAFNYQEKGRSEAETFYNDYYQRNFSFIKYNIIGDIIELTPKREDSITSEYEMSYVPQAEKVSSGKATAFEGFEDYVIRAMHIYCKQKQDLPITNELSMFNITQTMIMDALSPRNLQQDDKVIDIYDDNNNYYYYGSDGNYNIGTVGVANPDDIYPDISNIVQPRLTTDPDMPAPPTPTPEPTRNAYFFGFLASTINSSSTMQQRLDAISETNVLNSASVPFRHTITATPSPVGFYFIATTRALSSIMIDGRESLEFFDITSKTINGTEYNIYITKLQQRATFSGGELLLS